MLKGLRIANLLLLNAALLAGPLAAQSRLPNGDAVKVAVVVKLVQFVTWPQSALPTADRPVEFCVLGKDHWVPLLKEAAHGESVNGHAIKVTRIERAPQAMTCHVLVIGAAVELDGMDVLEKLPILTIRGEKTGQSQRAMVTLTIESGRTRFILDVERADRAHLRFSSKLLQLADAGLRGSP